MRVLFAVLALGVGFSPISLAKDQKGGDSPERIEADDSERSGIEATQSPEEDELETPPDPDVQDENLTNEPRVRASTAPVPVKSLGIDPALSPAGTPGPKTREAKTRKVRISKIGASSTPAARARKMRSEEILRADDVPLNLKLPAISDVGQTEQRTHREVVGRALAILTTAVKGEGLDQATVDALIDDFGAREFLSPAEAAFIAQTSPPTIDRVQFAWRYEAAWTMLWALSAVDELKPPRAIVDVRAIAEIVRGENVDSLVEKTSLRPMEEILDEADLIYRYRWALVDARIHDREPPAGLDPGVALERHRALNWLIGYLGQDWDDVTPDT